MRRTSAARNAQLSNTAQTFGDQMQAYTIADYIKTMDANESIQDEDV